GAETGAGEVTGAGEEIAGTIAGVLASGTSLCYLREMPGSAAFAVAAAACRQLGRRPIIIELSRLAPGDVPDDVATAAEREARLTGGALVAGPVEALAERGARAVQAFAELVCPVVLTGHRGWDPQWSHQVPLVVEAPALSRAGRVALWAAELNGDLDGVDVDRALGQFRLTPQQMARAALAARLAASAEHASVGVDALQAGARAQNAAGLDRLARRIEPGASWQDIVLPGVPLAQLHELAARARHRDRVLGDWGLGSPSRGRGITGLFAGE
ncbi:MAG: ATP-binding protein, partial [Actinomycetota bacterium]